MNQQSPERSKKTCNNTDGGCSNKPDARESLRPQRLCYLLKLSLCHFRCGVNIMKCWGSSIQMGSDFYLNIKGLRKQIQNVEANLINGAKQQGGLIHVTISRLVEVKYFNSLLEGVSMLATMTS